MMWKFDPEINNRLPKYKQIIAAIINDIEKGILEKDARLPSINELSFEYDIARDTVEKAYNELKEQGVITSVRGKGYFVNGLNNSKLRVLLIMNKLSAYKKLIYYSLINSFGEKAVVDLQIHHYNAELLQKILLEAKGKYHYYLIMPHFYEGLDRVDVAAELNAIPNGELVLLDRDFPGIKNEYTAVYQDFEQDVYGALEDAADLMKKYSQCCLVFPSDGHYPQEIIRGFRNYCNHFHRSYALAEEASAITLQQGTLYIVIEESDLAELVKKSRERSMELGKDIGILSFNETTLKQVLAGGIATISTHFEAMGSTAATLILEKKRIRLKNPFTLIRRGSF